MSADFHHPSEESWIEWKQRCALTLCREGTRSDLLSFGVPPIKNRFKEFNLGRLIPEENTELQCWHFLESYMHEVSSVSGKRWKDWLFEKPWGKQGTTLLEKMLQCCIETAVDRHLKLEGEVKTKLVEKGFISLEYLQPIISVEAESPHFLPIGREEKRDFQRASEDYSNDPSNDAGLAELRIIGRHLAETYFSEIPLHARVAILADSLGISLANPTVEAAAGRKSSVLYSVLNTPKTSKTGMTGKYGQLFDDLETLALNKYQNDDQKTFDLLIAAAILSLRDITFLWGKSEKSIETLFLLGDK